MSKEIHKDPLFKHGLVNPLTGWKRDEKKFEWKMWREPLEGIKNWRWEWRRWKNKRRRNTKSENEWTRWWHRNKEGETVYPSRKSRKAKDERKTRSSKNKVKTSMCSALKRKRKKEGGKKKSGERREDRAKSQTRNNERRGMAKKKRKWKKGNLHENEDGRERA